MATPPQIQRIRAIVEAERRHVDDGDAEELEPSPGGGWDALEAGAHDVPGVVGGEQQDESWPVNGDRDGDVEGEEKLAALGLAADDGGRLTPSQAVDEMRLASAWAADCPHRQHFPAAKQVCLESAASMPKSRMRWPATVRESPPVTVATPAKSAWMGTENRMARMASSRRPMVAPSRTRCGAGRAGA